MTVSDKTLVAEGLGEFFKNLSQKMIQCFGKHGKEGFENTRKIFGKWCSPL